MQPTPTIRTYSVAEIVEHSLIVRHPAHADQQSHAGKKGAAPSKGVGADTGRAVPTEGPLSTQRVVKVLQGSGLQLSVYDRKDKVTFPGYTVKKFNNSVVAVGHHPGSAALRVGPIPKDTTTNALLKAEGVLKGRGYETSTRLLQNGYILAANPIRKA